MQMARTNHQRTTRVCLPCHHHHATMSRTLQPRATGGAIPKVVAFWSKVLLLAPLLLVLQGRVLVVVFEAAGVEAWSPAFAPAAPAPARRRGAHWGYRHHHGSIRRHLKVQLQLAKRQQQRQPQDQKDQQQQPQQHLQSSSIYSIPALYDLAFGYRDFSEEVGFLLARHHELQQSRIDDHDASASKSIRVLEVAAGPARHALTALQEHGDGVVQDVYCVDVVPRNGRVRPANGPGRARRVRNKRAFTTKWTTCATLPSPPTTIQPSTRPGCCWGRSSTPPPTRTPSTACGPSTTQSNRAGRSFWNSRTPEKPSRMTECTRNGWAVPLRAVGMDGGGGGWELDSDDDDEEEEKR